jgi:Variant SH3 domain
LLEKKKEQKTKTMSDDDGWSDEDEGLQAPEVLFKVRVIKDYIPETNDHLTLLLDDLVFVFKKEVPGHPGFYEGETKGVVGILPSQYCSKPLDI